MTAEEIEKTIEDAIKDLKTLKDKLKEPFIRDAWTKFLLSKNQTKCDTCKKCNECGTKENDYDECNKCYECSECKKIRLKEINDIMTAMVELPKYSSEEEYDYSTRFTGSKYVFTFNISDVGETKGFKVDDKLFEILFFKQEFSCDGPTDLMLYINGKLYKTTALSKLPDIVCHFFHYIFNIDDLDIEYKEFKSIVDSSLISEMYKSDDIADIITGFYFDHKDLFVEYRHPHSYYYKDDDYNKPYCELDF